MRIIGVRASFKGFRFAVVDTDDKTTTWLNKEERSGLFFADDIEDKSQMLVQAAELFQSVIQEYSPIDHVCIKTTELKGSVNQKTLLEHAFSSVLMLVAAQAKIPVSETSYKDFTTVHKGNVKAFAAKKFGKSPKFWDDKIAEALLAVLKPKS